MIYFYPEELREFLPGLKKYSHENSILICGVLNSIICWYRVDEFITIPEFSWIDFNKIEFDILYQIRKKKDHTHVYVLVINDIIVVYYDINSNELSSDDINWFTQSQLIK